MAVKKRKMGRRKCQEETSMMIIFECSVSRD
jgi:hypothetical protein